MTVEIAVMNKMGVALATDSAVTVGRQKIFNSANKLFMLSKFHPIGIMVYNNASFAGYPWEVLIKEYRSFLGATTFPFVSDYGEHFIEWVNSIVSFLPVAHLERLLFEYTLSIFREISKRIRYRADKLSEENLSTAEDWQDLVLKEIDRYYDQLLKEKELASVSKSPDSLVGKNFNEIVNTATETIFPAEHINEEILDKLRIVVIEHIRRERLCESFSGIVIAGYGTKQIFPSFVEYSVDGYFHGWLKHIMVSDARIDLSNPACIKAFAQRDMIHTFIEGSDPTYNRYLYYFVSSLLCEKFPDAILSSLGIENEFTRVQLERDLKEIGKGLTGEFRTQIEKYRQMQHISPVLDAVEFLPKDELAAAAETLVNFTSFKRRVSLNHETVGGPVDVAVISKGDGFVWIKRKHYFEAEFNNHFFKNYYNNEGEVTDERVIKPDETGS